MCNHSDSNPALAEVTFKDNGGGMYNHQSSPTVTDSTFVGNSTSASGGGMHNDYYSNPTLTNVTFYDNYADDGGGMYNYDFSNPTLTNVSFSSNQTRVGYDGGGMYNYQSSPTLMNVTFSGNVADDGGGMYNTYGSPALTNTILWGNGAFNGSQIYNDNSTPTISYSDIQGSGGSGSWDTSLGTNGGGNIDNNPLFVRDPDPGNDDYGNLHLRLGSPAIDSGTNSGCPATDLDGNPRPHNGTCDMGAYERIERRVNLPLVLKLLSEEEDRRMHFSFGHWSLRAKRSNLHYSQFYQHASRAISDFPLRPCPSTPLR
jgi:hypothetical protein